MIDLGLALPNLIRLAEESVSCDAISRHFHEEAIYEETIN